MTGINMDQWPCATTWIEVNTTPLLEEYGGVIDDCNESVSTSDITASVSLLVTFFRREKEITWL